MSAIESREVPTGGNAAKHPARGGGARRARGSRTAEAGSRVSGWRRAAQAALLLLQRTRRSRFGSRCDQLRTGPGDAFDARVGAPRQGVRCRSAGMRKSQRCLDALDCPRASGRDSLRWSGLTGAASRPDRVEDGSRIEIVRVGQPARQLSELLGLGRKTGPVHASVVIAIDRDAAGRLFQAATAVMVQRVVDVAGTARASW